MTRSGLRLLLPAAAVYLAEAEWRAGNEDGADAAADAALGAAEFQGSNHILLQALSDFPAVAWRRADAEASADSAWHRLGGSCVPRRSPPRELTTVAGCRSSSLATVTCSSPEYRHGRGSETR